jgi:hypothetical protein
MPAWATVVLTFGASVIAILATLAGARLQHIYARRDRELAEQKELRERGAAVLTPISSLLSDCEPSQVVISASGLVGAGVLMLEQLASVDERLPVARDKLMAYANAHPMPEMAEAAFRLATATRNAVRATMWLLTEHLKVEGDSRYYLEASRSDHAHAERLLQAVLSAARGELDGPSLATRLGEVEKVKTADEERLIAEVENRAARN